MRMKSYRVGDLRRFIKESSTEFKPVLGPNVESDNKRNNEKSYKDAEKTAKDYDGGLKEPKKGKLSDKLDYNHTTLDYNPVTDPGKDYKDRINAQLKGYTSKLEMDNKIEKANATFDNDSKLKKYFEDSRDKMQKEKDDLASSGLQGSKLEEKNKNKQKNNLSENMKAKRLTFKNRRFLNEAQMLQRIPEEYKRNGQKIIMRDGFDNEYIVECTKNSLGNIETSVVKYNNKRIMNEQVDRIFGLMNYNKEEEKNERNFHTNLNENQSFKSLMDTVRNTK